MEESFRFNQQEVENLLLESGFSKESSRKNFIYEEENLVAFSLVYSLDKGRTTEAKLLLECFENEIGIILELKNDFKILQNSRKVMICIDGGFFQMKDGFSYNCFSRKNVLWQANLNLNKFIRKLKRLVEK